MSRPIAEQSVELELGHGAYRDDQLERRVYDEGAIQERKCFADRGALDGELPDQAILVVEGDGKAEWNIAPDMRNLVLVWVVAWVSVAASGDIEVTVRNVTQGINLVTVTIPGGDQSSPCTLATMDVPDDTPVDACDHIRIDVPADGGGDGEGLFVTLNWQPPNTT
jgi:hypothetical protein